uniref:Uncharacterized protein n=1 Tax=Glossina brevipalpis TaxID=37001 RepID=A0A1A9W6H3_9MUSC
MVVGIFGLLLACLSHDLDDHSGNKAFQTKAELPLAILCRTSITTHDEGDNILEYKQTNFYFLLIERPSPESPIARFKEFFAEPEKSFCNTYFEGGMPVSESHYEK